MDQQYNNDEDIDVEAVRPLPDESIDNYPSTAEAQPTTNSGFSGRTKIIGGIVAIVAVIAISAGIALSVKPSSDQESAGVSQNTNQDIVVVANDNNMSSSSTASDEEIDTTTPQQDEPWDNNTSDENDQEGDIMDMGYEQTSDQSISYSPGLPTDQLGDWDPESLQGDMFVLPSAVEKVPIEGDVEMNTFDGNIEDYIVGSARITVTAYQGKCTGNDGEWFMQLDTDSYPWETAWKMVEKQTGEIVMEGPPAGRKYERLTTYVGTMCVPAGTYTMQLTDKQQDGFCCDFGPGAMVVKVNGNTVLEKRGGAFATFERDIKITPSEGNNIPPNGGILNTPPPTPNPTTRNPTPAPVNDNLIPVTVKVRTDNFAPETGYRYVDLSTGQVLIDKPKGSLERNKLYTDTLRVAEGERHKFTIFDQFNGLEAPGYFAVEVNGEEVAYGGRFNNPQGEKSLVIRPDFKPTGMSAKDNLWLSEHNRRRKTFHEANGKQFKPLLWSNILEDSARAWITQISPTCQVIREPGLDPGENLSTRAVGANVSVDEGVQAIMRRWVDQKSNLGYPDNQSLTQVYWAASRYVGCADDVVDMADGKKCYVSICRYAQAGNCDMGKWKQKDANGVPITDANNKAIFDWKGAALADRSRCGPTCPERDVEGEDLNVCY